MFKISLCFIVFLFSSSANAIFRKITEISSARIVQVSFSPENKNFLAVASKNSIYVSDNGGGYFYEVAGVADQEIKHLTIDRETIYIASDRNVYLLKPNSSKTKIFSAHGDQTIYYIAKKDDNLFIATSEGLYTAKTSVLNWKPVTGLKNQKIYFVGAIDNKVYITSERGVYCFEKNESPRRLFTIGSDSDTFAYVITKDRCSGNLWMGTSRGLFYSTDSGQSWIKLYLTGLGNSSVYEINQFNGAEQSLLVASNNGLLKVDPKTEMVTTLFEGISSTKVWDIAVDENNKLFVATSHGLFTNEDLPNDVAKTVDSKSLKSILKNEPSVHETQEIAIRYNSVHPEKIAEWRERLKLRGLFPSVSVDYDKTISSSSGQFYEGPNDWGVSLSWDLADLIWNDYEDDIDNRNKLTTQLRIDILDEVNRIYFERIRLKQEILSASEETSESELFLKKLRFDELTAALDAYTGGYFSIISKD